MTRQELQNFKVRPEEYIAHEDNYLDDINFNDNNKTKWQILFFLIVKLNLE